MKPRRFAYVRPETMAEALALLSDRGSHAKLIAGGQSLMPALNMRLAAPSVLIDLGGIAALRTITRADDHIRIGAMTSYAALLTHPVIAQIAILARALPFVANPAVRNRGTLGGSLCHADPSAETFGALLALNAEFDIASPHGTRRVAADAYVRGVYQTVLRPDEILVAIVIPQPAPDWIWFDEHARRLGDFAEAGLAIAANRHGEALHALRIAIIGMGDRAFLARRTMARLEGRSLATPLVPQALDSLADDIADNCPTLRDGHRHALANDLLARALAEARRFTDTASEPQQ